MFYEGLLYTSVSKFYSFKVISFWTLESFYLIFKGEGVDVNLFYNSVFILRGTFIDI